MKKILILALYSLSPFVFSFEGDVTKKIVLNSEKSQEILEIMSGNINPHTSNWKAQIVINAYISETSGPMYIYRGYFDYLNGIKKAQGQEKLERTSDFLKSIGIGGVLFSQGSSYVQFLVDVSCFQGEDFNNELSCELTEKKD